MMRIAIVCLLIGMINMQIMNYRKRKKLEREKTYLEQMALEEKRQYQEIVEANQNLRYVNHDLQKYMNVVHEMIESGCDGRLTCDDVVDIILHQKKAEAEDKKIQFIADIDKSGVWKLKNGDVISLLTNLLDNAIEAAEQVKDNAKDKPFVSVLKTTQDDEVHIKIENSKNSDEKPIENDMKTTKPDSENHGYGTQIIREIIKKNGGYISMRDHGDTFLVIIRL